MLRAEGRQPLWTQDAMATEDAEHLIEIRVDRLAQLFHTLDPFPFREKDLDQDTEEYIVSWARELPDKRPVRIAVHIPDGDARAANSDELNEAFHHYFEGRAVAVQNDLNELCSGLAGARWPSEFRSSWHVSSLHDLPPDTCSKIRSRDWLKRAS
jgi:hypothetical protein